MGQATDFHDVFFSYYWDHAAVEALAQTLRQRWLHVSLDRWYLILSRLWPQVLEEFTASWGSGAIFVGPQGMGPWQQQGTCLILSRQVRDPNFPVVIILLQSANPASSFLPQKTWVDWRQRPDVSLFYEILKRDGARPSLRDRSFCPGSGYSGLPSGAPDPLGRRTPFSSVWFYWPARKARSSPGLGFCGGRLRLQAN